jgi:predicted permease
MSRFRGLRRFFRLPRFTAAHAASDVDEELRFHLDMRVRDLVALGRTPDEARTEALHEFGDVDRARRELRAEDAAFLRRTRRTERFDEARQDVGFALRQLRRAPGYALVVTLTLAIGVGATTAIFSVVDGVLLRPLPYADADRIVMIWQHDRNTGERDDVSPANFLDLEERSRSFERLAAIEPFGLDWMGPDGPESLRSWMVTQDFFAVMGARPYLGRVFTASEFVVGREKVAVLGYDTWRTRFGADSGVVGRVVSLDGEPFTIVGVMPPAFRFPEGRNVWHPKVWRDREAQQRASNWYWVVGRLRPGVTEEAARREVASIGARLATEYPRTNATTELRLVRLDDELLGRARPALLLLLAAVGFVLLIACANVANLVVARAVRRQREFAVRASLGAGAGRLARQLVTESLVLAALGGALGVLLAAWAVGLLRAASPATLPRADAIALDGRVLAFAIGVSLLAALAAGATPALRAATPHLHDALRSGGRGGGSREQRRLRAALVVGEIALAVVLVSGAALLGRSFVALLGEERGWRSGQVLAVTVQAWGYAPSAERRAEFVRQATARIAALPGVVAVGTTSSL